MAMIVSKTPYRVSFAGGGTDLPAFYRREFGAVLSVCIDHHIYVTINQSFSSKIRVCYSRTENVSHVDDVAHDLVREAMRAVEIPGAIEITTIGDIPEGTGMGSSSSLTVGLLNALYSYTGRSVGKEFLASRACQIEIDRLKRPIGRQDQYAAAFGGINYIRFNPDDTVDVEPVPCRPEVIADLSMRTLLFYTGQTRDSAGILGRQSEEMASNMPILRRMRDLADDMRGILIAGKDLDLFASRLHEGWELKRSLGFGISGRKVDLWYEMALRNGALGGKLLGAGGSGFLLLIAPPGAHRAIRDALGRPTELPFRITTQGSRSVII